MDGEKASEVLDTAVAAGYRITPDQMARLHRDGLIQTPIWKSLGADGSISIYPVGTSRQVLAVLQLRHAGISNNRIGWILWREGFPISDRYWRTPIVDAGNFLNRFLASTIETTNGERELNDSTNDLMMETAAARPKFKLTGLFRRTLRKSFETFLGISIRVAAGVYLIGSFPVEAEIQQEHRSIFGRVLGIVAPSKRPNPDLEHASFVVDPLVFETMLKTLSEEYSKYWKKDKAFDFSDDEMLTASRELSQLLFITTSVGNYEQQTFGKPSPGFRILMFLVSDLTPRRNATLVVLWMIARRIPAIGDGARHFLANARSAMETSSKGQSAV